MGFCYAYGDRTFAIALRSVVAAWLAWRQDPGSSTAGVAPRAEDDTRRACLPLQPEATWGASKKASGLSLGRCGDPQLKLPAQHPWHGGRTVLGIHGRILRKGACDGRLHKHQSLSPRYITLDLLQSSEASAPIQEPGTTKTVVVGACMGLLSWPRDRPRTRWEHVRASCMARLAPLRLSVRGTELRKLTELVAPAHSHT